MPRRFAEMFSCVLVAALLAACAAPGGASRRAPEQPASARPAPMQRMPGARALSEARAQQLFVRGMTLAYAGDPTGAIRLYQQALELKPNEAAILSALAEAHAAAADFATAQFYMQQALAAAPQNAYYQWQSARMLAAAGNIEAAADTYRALVERDPEQVGTLLELAQVHADGGRLTEALAALREANALLGDDRDVLQRILQLQMRLDDAAGIEETLKALLALNPGDTGAAEVLSRLYLKQERTADAIRLLEKSRLNNPHDYAATLALADLYRSAGAAARADSLEAATRAGAADSPGRLLARASALYQRAPFDSAAAEQATALLERAVELDPAGVEARTALGEILFLRQDYKRAAPLLQQSAETNPRDLDLWEKAAAAYLEAGEPLKAARLADDALLLFPGQLSLLRTAGYAFLQAYRNEPAIARLAEAVAVMTADGVEDPAAASEMYAAMALAYARGKNAAASDSLYARALESDPANAFALNNFAYDLAERNVRLSDALGMGKRAVALEPENAAFLDTLGWIYFKLNQLSDAQAWVAKAVATGAAGPAVYEHLGDIYARQGKTNSARDAYQQALARNPGSATLPQKLKRLSTR